VANILDRTVWVSSLAPTSPRAHSADEPDLGFDDEELDDEFEDEFDDEEDFDDDDDWEDEFEDEDLDELEDE
jgi:hypothetical protein